MRIAYPWALWLYGLVPLTGILFLWAYRWRRRALFVFGDPATVGRLIKRECRRRRAVKNICTIVAVFFICTAAVGPQLGTRMVEVHRRGVDIFIAVDCSRSMLAEDVMPNRLARAKLALSSLIQGLEGDKVGIIAFAGTAFLQCPLTLDYSAAKLFLDFIEIGLIPRPGTALGDAIRLAIRSFSRKERKYKVLILLTDGEDHGSEPIAAAREARREGIRILTVGIGSPDGEPIPVRGPDGKISGYKKDRAGDIIMSRLDEVALQKIALETGGKYFRATTGAIEIDGILDEISRMEKKELQSRILSQHENRYQVFLLFAVLLLFISFLLPEQGPVFLTRNIAAVAICLMFVPAAAGASVRSKVNNANSLYGSGKYEEALDVYRDAQIDNPESSVLHFNTGNALYRAESYEEAYAEFGKAIESKDIGMQAEAYYNMGNALYRQGKLPDAILHYRKALELDEADEDARYNIEYVQRKIKEQADKNKQHGQHQQEQQDRQNQQQPDQGQQQDQPKDQGGQDKDKKDQQGKPDGDNNDREKKPPSDEQKKKKDGMNKEDAERLLKSLEDQEKEAQKQRRTHPGRVPGVAEDW